MTLARNRYFPLLLLVCFLLFASLCLSFSPVARWVPAGSAVSGAVLCLFLLGRKEEVAEGRRGTSPWGVVGTLLIASSITGLVGILAAVPATYVSYAWFSGEKDWWRVLLLAVISTLAIYLIFGLLLEIPLTRNLS
jgi:hypothetical protein